MTNTTKAKREAQAEAIDTLQKLILPGTTVYTDLISVSHDGMSRHLRVFLALTRYNGEPYIRNITRLVGAAGGHRMSKDGDDLVIGGAGMDMGFATVYNLSRTLFPEGFECIGDNCPSNDHSNGDYDRRPGHAVHHDGGYALQAQWL